MQPCERSITFTGPFAEACTRFVAEKRAIGYRYRGEAVLLRAFGRFSQAAGVTPPVLSKDLVVAWIEKRPHERPRTQQARIYVIRQFALFLARQGYEAYILPTHMYPKPAKTFTPYIFTREELARVFQAADTLPARAVAPTRHRVLPLLLRMLYGCGVRVSEALGLRVRDVNLDEGVLTILGAKFGKDRLIPMAASLTQRCRDYAREVLGTAAGDAPFFPAPDHGPYSANTIYMNYRELLWQCRISHGGRGHGPRLHDLRHTFAVHCLQRWVQEGKDLTTALPVLSTYLGHASLDGTQLYLRLTAELYPEITQAVEASFRQVIPEGRTV